MENSQPTIGERQGFSIQTQGMGNAICSRSPPVQDDGDDDTTIKAGEGNRGPDEPTKPIQEEPKQKIPDQNLNEKQHVEKETSFVFCGSGGNKSKEEGKDRNDSDVSLLNPELPDHRVEGSVEGHHDYSSLSYRPQQTLGPDLSEMGPQSLPSQLNRVTTTSFDPSKPEIRCKETPQDNMQPKVLPQSDQSPLPLPRNLLSMYSTENARYSVAEAPRPDHPNDDRFFHYSNPGNNFKAFGVFDGHDGNNASDFASEYMEKYMEEIFLTKVGDDSEIKSTLQDRIEKTLCEMFLKTDGAFFRRIESVLKEKKQIRKALQGYTSYEAYMLFPNHVARLQEIEPEISGGTTAVVAVLMDDWLYVANAGDSRAVLVQEVECDENQLYSTQLTVDHTVDNEAELWRLEAIGLDSEELKKTGRLGSQENTRCIGDYLIKEGYTEVDTISHALEPPGIAIPNVKMMQVPAKSRYLLLMTDGVYKSLESMQDPANLKTYDPMHDLIVKIQEAEKESPKSFQEISKVILSMIEENHHKTYQENAPTDVKSPLAIQCRKRDDMTLIVYRFRHNNNKSD